MYEDCGRQALGTAGEEAAARYLTALGYTVLERNYRCGHGEIDIIAERNGRISFVEVKTRRWHGYGRPAEAVDADKKRRIRRTAMHYLKYSEGGGRIFSGIEFDVVEVMLEHTRGAF